MNSRFKIIVLDNNYLVDISEEDDGWFRPEGHYVWDFEISEADSYIMFVLEYPTEFVSSLSSYRVEIDAVEVERVLVTEEEFFKHRKPKSQIRLGPYLTPISLQYE